MISFNLSCVHGHGFEGWFSSSADFDDQQTRGLVTCPVCDSGDVKKALMAPNISAKSNQGASTGIMPIPDQAPNESLNEPLATPEPSPSVAGPVSGPASSDMTASMAPPSHPQVTPEMQEKLGEALTEIRKFQKTVEANCEDVGRGFATEARKIHYGEAEPRGIFGNTSDSEAESLIDEGIEITKMPWLPKEN